MYRIDLSVNRNDAFFDLTTEVEIYQRKQRKKMKRGKCSRKKERFKILLSTTLISVIIRFDQIEYI